MYYIVIWHLDILWNDHHNESSNHLSPYKVFTIPLTILLMWYITLPMAYLFYNWRFVPFNPLHLFHLLKSLPPSNHLFALCIYESVSVLLQSFIIFFLDSIYKWDCILFIFIWPISLNITPSLSIHIVINDKVTFLYDCVIFHCICIPHHLYSFIYQQTLRLLPYFGYCK